MDLSVVIITYNEEFNLGRCLRSLPRGCEIVVVDSDSTDRTIEIARSFGSKIISKPFKNFADQKNAGIEHATRTWVFSIDADEELNPKLSNALNEVITNSSTDSCNGYRIQRKLVFMGRQMHWGKTSDEPVRLFKKGKGTFNGAIHEKLELSEGSPGQLAGTLLHYSYRNLTDYFNRFNRYTSLIAEEKAKVHTSFSFMGHVLRPWIEFLNRYIFRLGFLDGYPGYVYALNSSLYAFIKYSKLIESQSNQTLQD